MPSAAVRFSAWGAVVSIILAIAAYFAALGSDHAATNGDELLYAQIARVTAESGALLPLQTAIEFHRNTKPPALFWQGIITTDWAKKWTLWNLRWPNAAYSFGIAAMVFLIARKLSGNASTGLLAALAYLAFFGTYRYGRVFLTSAPETFWLFAPFFILLCFAKNQTGTTWLQAPAFGLMFGAALLYKSFALVLPATAGLAWWGLHQRGYRFGEWLRRDVPRVALTGVVALGVFSLWFVLDPERELLFRDFVLKENVGKFNTGGQNYFLNLLWGQSSIWRNVAAIPINAGLLALATVALFVIAWIKRRGTTEPERLLWIWIATVFLAFTLPNQRDERYLLPAMPAVAVLLALHWTQIPRWIFCITLLAVALIALGMVLGGALLTATAGLGALYPWYAWLVLGAVIGFAAVGFFRKNLTHTLAVPAILSLYLGYAAFLIPFDGPLGEFDGKATAFAEGKTIPAPINFNAREEIYEFMLPGARFAPYHTRKNTPVEKLAEPGAFIATVDLGDKTIESNPRFRIVGTRLQLIDRFNNAETIDMLKGNVARHLFKKDLLVEVLPAAQ